MMTTFLLPPLSTSNLWQSQLQLLIVSSMCIKEHTEHFVLAEKHLPILKQRHIRHITLSGHFTCHLNTSKPSKQAHLRKMHSETVRHVFCIFRASIVSLQLLPLKETPPGRRKTTPTIPERADRNKSKKLFLFLVKHQLD